jgi:site-specific DNA-methyltransferase (adenine-specific)
MVIMKYKIIYADPAWSYDKKIGQGIADDHYKTMPTEEIKKLPISEMSEDDSVLFMWAVCPMLKDAFEVIKAWGFDYKTVAFVWVKLTEKGTPFISTGHYTRSNAELCLIARKGKGIELKDNTISQIVFSNREGHSVKPKKVYSLIERMYGDLKRIELFARHKRQGWDAWGNQVPKEQQNILQ